MPKGREHKQLGAVIKSLLGMGLDIDEGAFDMGLRFPDLDLIPPLQHRRSLHNPIALLPFVFGGKKGMSFFLGALTHILHDRAFRKFKKGGVSKTKRRKQK